jgi:LPPG:FO 2-phospho-L-lactate transferase
LQRVVALAGGSGSAKLVRGLATLTDELTVVSNVGDNLWMHGLYICPDVDIATYVLAGILHRRGWGVKEDTFRTLSQLAALGAETWFRLGDRDLATHILRTKMLKEGRRLTEVTLEICNRLNVLGKVLPCTDSELQTYIKTNRGELHLQEFWVKEKGRPEVLGVRYKGSDRAVATKEVLSAIQGAHRIVICPANPISSIGPILAVRGVREAIVKSRARKVAVSPMLGNAPFSGPAGKMMKAVGLRTDSVGLAAFYRGLVNVVVIDQEDVKMRSDIEAEGVECVLASTLMKKRSDEIRLATKVAGV